MLVSTSAALDASRSAETTRRAVSPSSGVAAVPEGGIDSRAAGCVSLDPADADTTQAAPGRRRTTGPARAGAGPCRHSRCRLGGKVRRPGSPRSSGQARTGHTLGLRNAWGRLGTPSRLRCDRYDDGRSRPARRKRGPGQDGAAARCPKSRAQGAGKGAEKGAGAHGAAGIQGAGKGAGRQIRAAGTQSAWKGAGRQIAGRGTRGSTPRPLRSGHRPAVQGKRPEDRQERCEARRLPQRAQLGRVLRPPPREGWRCPKGPGQRPLEAALKQTPLAWILSESRTRSWPRPPPPSPGRPSL